MKSFCILLVLLAMCVLGCNQLRQSEEGLRRNILQQVPLGSDMSVVISYLEANEYRIAWINRDEGFPDRRVKPASISGDMSLRSEFGEYRKGLSIISVTVFFAFNKNGELVDIWVWKTADSV